MIEIMQFLSKSSEQCKKYMSYFILPSILYCQAWPCSRLRYERVKMVHNIGNSEFSKVALMHVIVSFDTQLFFGFVRLTRTRALFNT